MAAATKRSALYVVGAAVFASPVAAVWMATTDSAAPARHRTRAATAVGVLALAATLIALPLRWEAAAAIWGAICLLSGVGALSLRTDAPVDDAARSSELGLSALRAAVIALAAAPALVVSSWTVAAALLGPVLVRIDPTPADPRLLLDALTTTLLWAVPAMALFAALSVRSDRLLNPADILRAAAAWSFYLVFYEFVWLGVLRAIDLQLRVADTALAEVASFAVATGFVLVAVPVTLALAWSPASLTRRALATLAFLTAGFVNLGILTGLPASAEFALARAAESRGEAEAAIRWYGRSLIKRSTPLLEAHVQQRIGLLRYQLGDIDRARAAFQLVATTRGGTPEVVRLATQYLDRLDLALPGERVVLQGVAGPTEHRDAYCAPNTLAQVLRYWRSPLTAAEIGEEIAHLGGGTSLPDMAIFLDRIHFELMVKPLATETDLRWLIDHGVPALVFVPAHVLAVFGYDRRLDTFVAYDTSVWDLWLDHPVPTLLEEWGKEDFLLGVVLPRAAADANVAAIRQRFGGPSSEAEIHLALMDVADRSEARRQLRAAARSAPENPRVAFELSWRDARHSFEQRTPAEVIAIAATARNVITRKSADVATWSRRLASWWLHRGGEREILVLASQLEANGQLDAMRESASVAAARLGDWQRASFLSGSEAMETQAGRRARLDAALALGQPDRAAEATIALASEAVHRHVDEALRAARASLAGRGAVHAEQVLSPLFFECPDCADLALEVAQASIEALEADAPGDRRERITGARRALAWSRAIAPSPESGSRRAELAARLTLIRERRSDQ